MAALWIQAPRPAAAASVPVQIEIKACNYLDRGEVLRVLRAELRIPTTAEGSADATRALIVCSGERLVIEVSDPISRKLLRRNFALQEPEHPGMSRLVGIAAAELVLASWAEVALNAQPRVEPEGAPPSAEVLASVRSRLEPEPQSPPKGPVPPTPPWTVSPAELPDWPEREEEEPNATSLATDFRIGAVGSRRAFFNHTGALAGGGARVGSDPLPFTSWSADVLVEMGELKSGDRRYELEAWTVGFQIFAHKSVSFVTFRLGAGLRAGLTDSSSISQEARGARSVAPWGWPLLAAGITLRLHEKLGLELTGEGSYVALPVASGSTGDTLRGTWFGTQVGLSYYP